MPAPDDRDRKLSHPAAGTLLLIAFGVFLLAFLIGIERQNWFHLRPASGTAAAMGYATDVTTPTTASDGSAAAGAAN